VRVAEACGGGRGIAANGVAALDQRLRIRHNNQRMFSTSRLLASIRRALPTCCISAKIFTLASAYRGGDNKSGNNKPFSDGNVSGHMLLSVVL